MYSEYVSLGYNCEPAFQMRRILGRDSPSFFSWNVTTLPQAESLIANRFEGVVRDDQIGPHGGGLLKDAAYGYLFHSPFAGEDFRSDPAYDDKLQKYRERTSHLVQKFLRPRELSERTAYFYKAENQKTTEEVRQGSRRVRDLLLRLHENSSFVLVVLQHVQWQEDPWDEPDIFNRYLHRLAPYNDAPDGHARSWDAVFREFPHRDPLRFCLS